jgi:fibronectin type 3 domain-containing protein
MAVSMVVPTLQAAPSAPEDLQAEAGKDYVDLGWQTSDDATHYALYRGTGEDDMTRIVNITAPITAYHDAGLEDGSSFIYYVTAVNDDGESEPSNSVSITVPAKEGAENMLPILALVLSAIAIQVCAVMLLFFFKMKMK